MLRRCLILLSLPLLQACSTVVPVGKRVETVNPASLAAAPAAYDGREVQVIGLLVWDGATQQLQQSYGTYCRASAASAIGVDWTRWPAVAPKDHLRRVAVRGTFRATTAAASPAPVAAGMLEPGYVLRWVSGPERPCPNKIGQ